MSWVSSLDSKGVKGAAATAGVASLIPLLVFLDSIYAHSADLEAMNLDHIQHLEQFQGVLGTFVIDSYERDIVILEEEIAELQSVFDHLTVSEKMALSKRKARRAAYIRKLERLKE